jgi:hypothetical protein
LAKQQQKQRSNAPSVGQPGAWALVSPAALASGGLSLLPLLNHHMKRIALFFSQLFPNAL